MDYVLSVKGPAHKLVTTKDSQSCFQKIKLKQVRHSEAPFCFLTCSLTGDLNIEYEANGVPGELLDDRGIMVQFLEGKTGHFCTLNHSK